MGLTIHYSLQADAATDARGLVEQLHQAALDLPFEEVGEIVELTGDALNPDNTNEGWLKWLLIQTANCLQTEAGITVVDPTHVIAFTTWPGPGCEVANFGLCRYPDAVAIDGGEVDLPLEGWHWKSFCKTQYASNPADGDIENFLRCHLTVIKFLDHAADLGLLAGVNDEGGFWEERDVAALVGTIGRWNQHLAAFVDQCQAWFGNEIQAPIKDYPNFDELKSDEE